MTTPELTPTDVHLRTRVLQELEWDSQCDASAIGVAVSGRAVTLTGFVDTYAGKLAAERAVKRIRGVRAVANDLQVRLRLERTDSDIATDAAQALTLRTDVPDTVQASVHYGHLTLTGTVRTPFERALAEEAVQAIRGVKGIVNQIAVTKGAVGAEHAVHIAGALGRHADVGTYGIEVTTSGDSVVLKGTVRSWREREEAERAAMHSPGVSHVVNLIVVGQDDEVGG